MNTVVTSREQILAASRKLIAEKGWAQVNIRSVAAACGVSVGSIYNYFPRSTSWCVPQWKASGVYFS